MDSSPQIICRGFTYWKKRRSLEVERRTSPMIELGQCRIGRITDSRKEAEEKQSIGDTADEDGPYEGEDDGITEGRNEEDDYRLDEHEYHSWIVAISRIHLKFQCRIPPLRVRNMRYRLFIAHNFLVFLTGESLYVDRGYVFFCEIDLLPLWNEVKTNCLMYTKNSSICAKNWICFRNGSRSHDRILHVVSPGRAVTVRRVEDLMKMTSTQILISHSMDRSNIIRWGALRWWVIISN